MPLSSEPPGRGGEDLLQHVATVAVAAGECLLRDDGEPPRASGVSRWSNSGSLSMESTHDQSTEPSAPASTTPRPLPKAAYRRFDGRKPPWR